MEQLIQENISKDTKDRRWLGVTCIDLMKGKFYLAECLVCYNNMSGLVEESRAADELNSAELFLLPPTPFS